MNKDQKQKGSNPRQMTSDGSSADYYVLPKEATQLQDLISYRNMNAQIGEIFRAAYRYGQASHSGQLRDAKKMLFYAHAEVRRLEREIEQEAEQQKVQAYAQPDWPELHNEEGRAIPPQETPNPARIQKQLARIFACIAPHIRSVGSQLPNEVDTKRVFQDVRDLITYDDLIFVLIRYFPHLRQKL